MAHAAEKYMARKYQKYTKEILEPIVKMCFSRAEVLRNLGLRPTGGSNKHIGDLIDRFGIDTSHFSGQYAALEKTRGWNKKEPQQHLVKREENSPKIKRAVLHRCLQELGRPYLCAICGLGDEWVGRPITLQIDHISGEGWDNREDNLRYLCPNCHSQTETFGALNKRE